MNTRTTENAPQTWGEGWGGVGRGEGEGLRPQGQSMLANPGRFGTF